MKIYQSLYTETDFDKVHALDLRKEYEIDWLYLSLYENLKYLNLSGHDLAPFTEEIVQFKQLETLIINNKVDYARKISVHEYLLRSLSLGANPRYPRKSKQYSKCRC